MRRLLLLAVVVGTQFATGCNCCRPFLPRLQAGFGCRTGACGGPLLGGGAPAQPAAGCVGCESTGGVSSGYPLSTVPPGQVGAAAGMPYSGTIHGYPGVPAGLAPMPMLMPTAMPGGIPHDSALLKMPTIVPPSTSKRPGELASEITGRK